MNKNDRSNLLAVLQENSLVIIGKINTNEAFSLRIRKQDEFAAVFLPNLQSIRGTKVLTGVVGVARLIDTGRIHKLSFLLSEHTFNFPELSYLHEFGSDREEDVRWCAKVSNILRELPTNRMAIENMIEKSTVIHGVSILDMLHQDN